ncbi:uncharacterized protein LOC122255263 [Penaeus japonicus]|uniref:uncharacterized protein LOC122255263 n=1 Tax=Penaeus japonicus TaxID=27405 RepID=UPI001C715697|nr:uncharacterized protein LOC122255263 [Penaeus japonicus]
MAEEIEKKRLRVMRKNEDEATSASFQYLAPYISTMNGWRMIIRLVTIAQCVISGENYKNLTGVVVTSGVCVDMAERNLTSDKRISTATMRYTSVELKKLRYKCDVIGVSETWFSRNKPAKLYALPGYELLHKDRETRGGGVALYLRNELNIRNINIGVPDNLECVWAMIEQNFSRHVKKLLLCCLYHPPGAPSHDELLEHLVTTVDAVRSTYSDARVVILGDCNDLDVNHLTTLLGLRCIVTTPTHRNSTIDLILTDAEFYTNSETEPPIGLSHHLCVVSRPDVHTALPAYNVRTFRPFLDSSTRQFGQWITREEWGDVLATRDADEAADAMERVLLERYEACFPERRQRTRTESKPWITARILRLAEARRRAYDRGHMSRWRELYHQVKREIKNAKRQKVVPTIDRITVYETLLSLRANKASPPGSLPKKLLHEFAYEISEPLTHVINSSIESGIFPRRWKGATITPLAKKNPVNELGDLRPLSLTPDFGKILEGFVAQLVLQDIRPNLDPEQYGNLKGKSPTHYMTSLLNTILKALDKPKKIAQIVLIDFKKAFDFVDHTVAIRELYLLGCRPHLLAFVTSFLSDRRHRVRYQDALSDWDSISCGVPQGTRLGPVVFLAIINRLCSNVDIRAKYVDDLTLAEIVDVKETLHFTMPNLLNELSEGCAYAKMTPNPMKCEVLHVCPSKRPIMFPELILDNSPLPIVNHCKLLGIHINSQLNWDDHIDYIISKASRNLFILYRAKQFNLNQTVIFTLYSWFIRTILEYAAPVWHPGLTQAHHTRLERIQKRCLRIILSPNYTDYSDALNQLGCETLYLRREELTLRFGKSLLKSNEFRHLLPQYLHEIHGRETRRGRQLLQPVRCRTQRYKNSTIPYIVGQINQLTSDP